MTEKKIKFQNVTTYEELTKKIMSVLEKDNKPLMGNFIPAELGVYWLVGGKLVWFAEELLETLSSDLRKHTKRNWSPKDLTKMAQLYLRYRTVEQFAGRCVGRKANMTLDELLDREAI